MRMISKLTRLAASVLLMCSVLLALSYSVRAGFINTPVNAEVPFECVKAEKVLGEKYNIVIERMDESSPEPDTDEITLSGTGTGVFGIEIDEPGTYQYKVYERTGANKNIIYDDTIYEVTLFVTQDDDGILHYQVILSNGSIFKPAEIKFVNKSKDSGGAVIATGEQLSAFIPYAFAAFGIGCSILILARVRRKEMEADD